MGAAMKTIRVSRGIGGSTPRSPAAFVAMVHATFDSAEVFASAFAPYAAELQRDAPSYTNIQPVVQISEVLRSIDCVTLCLEAVELIRPPIVTKVLRSPVMPAKPSIP
jgi:hypothetical protein